MSDLSPAPKAPVESEDPSQLPATLSPRQHRHRHHHRDSHDSSPEPSTTKHSSRKHLSEDKANPVSTSNTANGSDPLAADVSLSSVPSGRSRTRRSHRSTTASRPGAAFDLLGDGLRNGLTICCDGVSVQRHHRDVVDDVSCLFRGGRVTAVVNCCGTHSALALLAAVSGRVDCSAGNLVVNGVPVSASSYQAQMSFVEESDPLTDDGGATSDLLSELTVRENLEYASALRVANSAQAYSVDEMLQQLLLEPHAHARIRDCSLYVRRRVALGKELLLNPSVLILDEPMDGLATHEAQQFLTILSKLAAPSAADAEARHVMREAMAATASAAALTQGAAANAVVVAAEEEENAATMSAAAPSPSTPSRVSSLYTPRHSRLHPSDSTSTAAAAGGFSPSASNSVAPSSATAQNNSSYNHYNSSNGGGGGGLSGAGAHFSDETQRVIILSMVQPRWALLQYVHDVVLLERKRCVFAGSVQDMLSVKIPKSAVILSPAEAARESGEVGSPLAAGAPPPPAGSYAAVAASIHQTRLNEELVHGLYRLATAAVVGVSAGSLAGDFPEFGSFLYNRESTESRTGVSPTNHRGGASPTSVTPASPVVAGGDPAHPSRSSSFVAVRADGHYSTPLSELYKIPFGHTRAQVTAYMEACAAGLLTLPEASHQAPSSVMQLLHLFRFGFIEVRHNLVFDLVALAFLLILAAVLAALYGVQHGKRGAQNRTGLLFFVVCCVVLQAVLSLDAQRREYAAFYRYSRSGYYAAWTFLLFRAVTAALWRFGLATLAGLVCFALSNVSDAWRYWVGIFELGVIMAVLSYCCYFLVWFLCAWWPSDRVSRFIVFTFYTLNIVLAGLVLNLATLPVAVRGVSYLSVMRLAFESSILTQFLGRSFDYDDDEIAGSVAASGKIGRSAALTNSGGGGTIGASSGLWSATPTHVSPLLPRDNTAAAAATVTDALRQNGGHNSPTHPQELRATHIKPASVDAYPILQSRSSFTGGEYAAYLGFDKAHCWSNVGVLAGLSGVLLLASWIMMVLYRPRRRLKMAV